MDADLQFLNQNYSINTSRVTDHIDHDDPFLIQKTLIGYWELILFLIGLPANIFVIHLCRLLLRDPSDNHSNHHSCILSVTLADLQFSTIHCLLMFFHYAFGVQFDRSTCWLVYFFTHVSTVGSSLSLLLLNVDKFIFLTYPLHYYELLTKQRTMALLTVVWTLSIGWSVLFVFGPFAVFEDACRVSIYSFETYLAFLIIFFILPISLSLLISVYIFWVAHQQSQKFDWYYYHHGRSSLSKRPRGSLTTTQLLPCSNDNDNSGVVGDVIGAGPMRGRLATNASLLEDHLHRRRSSCQSCGSGGVSRLKAITFVFSTSLWSFVTALPYRLAFVAYHFYPNHWLANLSFGLFALMIANASFNPFITISTQYLYREKSKQIIGPVLKKFCWFSDKNRSDFEECKNRRRCEWTVGSNAANGAGDQRNIV